MSSNSNVGRSSIPRPVTLQEIQQRSGLSSSETSNTSNVLPSQRVNTSRLSLANLPSSIINMASQNEYGHIIPLSNLGSNQEDTIMINATPHQERRTSLIEDLISYSQQPQRTQQIVPLQVPPPIRPQPLQQLMLPSQIPSQILSQPPQSPQLPIQTLQPQNIIRQPIRPTQLQQPVIQPQSIQQLIVPQNVTQSRSQPSNVRSTLLPRVTPNTAQQRKQNQWGQPNQIVLPQIPFKFRRGDPILTTLQTQFGPKVIYDSQIDIKYPNDYRFPQPLNEFITYLKVPSSRYYYLSKSGYRVPLLSDSVLGIEQMKKDYYALGNDKVETPYREVVTTTSVMLSDEEKLAYALTGRSLDRILDSSFQRRYFNQLQGDYSMKNFMIGDTLLMRYPYNPSVSSRISRLLQINLENYIAFDVKSYFDEEEIFTFDQSYFDVIPIQERFFYLTRYYGTPSIYSTVSQNKYGMLANKYKTSKYFEFVKINIPSQIIGITSVLYQQYKNSLDDILENMLKDPNKDWLSFFGAHNIRLLYSSFITNYFKIYFEKLQLPQLSIEYLKTLAPIDRVMKEILRSYTDKEILAALPYFSVRNIFESSFYRDNILNAISMLLIENTYEILNQEEGENRCKNKITLTTEERWNEVNEPILSIGNLLDGYRCYNLEELFQSFENSRNEGYYAFNDPIDLTRRNKFSEEDLESIINSIENKPRTFWGFFNPNLRTVYIEALDNYIEIMREQRTNMGAKINELRDFADESEENKEKIRNLFHYLFYMAMYMRQWEGPPNPFPFSASETGETSLDNAPDWVCDNVNEVGLDYLEVLESLPEEIKEAFESLIIRSKNHVYDYSIGFDTDRVISKGDTCIRTSSATWAYSAIYYLKQILDEEIPGVEGEIEIEQIH